MIYPSLRSFVLLWATNVAAGDSFDDAVSAEVSRLSIRGAAITFFDAQRMESPVTRGYGKVSSDPSSAAVTSDTAFMLASVSKPFAASAVAVLVDTGVIASIDDDICDVIPLDYGTQICRNPNHPTVAVTWRMILTHRSSMKRSLPSAKNANGEPISPTYGPSGGYVTDSPAAGNPTCPLEGVVDFYRALLTDDADVQTSVGAGVILQGGDELNWYDLAQSNGGMWHPYKPGAKNNYSNAAYGYLPALIEFATGTSFAELSREHLFGPLGMDHTAWFREDLPQGTREALPVEKNGQGFLDIGHYCFIDYASGSLRTSAKDLEAWGNAMLAYGASTLWSTEMGDEIVACQERKVNKMPVSQKDCEFGYGWILLDNSKKITTTENWLKQGFKDYDWTDGIWHDGAEVGSQTNILILPKAGVYVAVLTNTDLNSETAAQQLTKAIVDAPLPALDPGTPTSAPITAPTSAPNPAPTNCPGESEFVFSITTDKFPKETKWVLKRNNKTIRQRGYNTYKKKFHSYQESAYCIPQKGNYKFIIEDRYGDGICCNEGNGRYEISIDGNVKKSGGDFNIKEVTKWWSN